MIIKINLPHPSSLREARGFALIATISIMALLVMIALGMLSLSAVEVRSSQNGRAMAEAQANARMALMIAIGELQDSLGPDQRISARGATLAKHEELLSTSVEAQSAKAWWVGAASSDVTETIGSSNQPVVWLVSGLNRSATSKAQIESSTPFQQEVVMFGENSIDFTLTGGEPLNAGKVSIIDGQGTKTGSYAYFVDDNGMKAQLSASHPDVVNTDVSTERPGGTVIPGSYDLGVLKAEGMDALSGNAGNTMGNYLKINSVNDLPFLGGATQISKNKRLSYTTQSFGVLSDVKNGGLKKDLTIAFENYEIDPSQAFHPLGGDYPNWPVYSVFDEVFKKTSDSEWDKYLAVDESRWNEFGENGYIHWAVFRDYYNLKRHIKRQNGMNEKGQNESMDYLDPITYRGPASFSGGYKYYAKGQLAPHDIGPDSSDPALRPGGAYENMPYGDFQTIPNTSNLNDEKEFMQYYKHSPISLVLTRIQTNAWVDQGVISKGYRDKADLTDIKDALRTRVQVFSTHYNPYNITMRCYGQKKNLMLTGGTPVAKFAFDDGAIPFAPYEYYNGGGGAFRFSGVSITAQPPYEVISANKHALNERRYEAEGDLMIGPGRSRIGGFGEDIAAGQSTGSKTFTLNIADNLDKSIYIDYNLVDTLPTSFNLTAKFNATQAMGHGSVDRHPQTASQWIWVPLSKQDLNEGSNEITIDAPGSGLGPDKSRTGIALELRTTTDENDSIRALIDANIRGFYFNPRWDSPLISADEPLHTSAAYKLTKLEDLSDSQAPQMEFANNADGDQTGGLGYWGNDHDSFGNSRVILFDIPRKDLVSLGQLQHAGAGRFSYEPSYIVGNSYANPRIPQGDWKTTFADTFSTTRSGVKATKGLITLYDASYLMNETLWDSYIFTTIPQNADNYDPDDKFNEPPVDIDLFTKLLKGEEHLANPRFIPYEPSGSTFDMATLQRVGDTTNTTNKSAFYYNAGHLLVDGAFNVNSTSVDAWEAFLSSTYGMPYQKMDDTGNIVGYEPLPQNVRFPRLQTVFGESFETSNPTDEGYWTGFRALSSDEIRELAVEIVDQVVARGPFLTLGEFVNRKLEGGELGEKGALQAALDNTVNDGIMSGYEKQTTHPKLPSGENQAAGFPGQLLQGDILQALSPFMTVHSDTFTIRAYGESLNPNTGAIVAKAWCEAVVQRYPDPVAPDPGKTFLEELAQPSSPHGRVFRITRFRWLNANEI